MIAFEENNLIIYNWLFGRSVELLPGKNNKVRAVTVKAKRGISKKQIAKLSFNKWLIKII